MNVVDSSAWLEYFADGPNASFFAPVIERTADMVVPSLTLYEVFKRILQQRGEDSALRAVAAMQQATVADIDAVVALRAAKISVEHKLPMADSIILATTQIHDAILWTQDADFERFPDVRYRKRQPPSE